MMIWADHIQKSVFRHSGTLWLPRRFSAIICFLLRARFKKIISNIYHDSKIYNRVAFGTSFLYLKAFPSPSPGCPRMTNQLFSKHYQGVLPSKKCNRRLALWYVILKALLWPELVKACWYLPPYWICISFKKKKLMTFLRSWQNYTKSQFRLSWRYMTPEVEKKS